MDNTFEQAPASDFSYGFIIDIFSGTEASDIPLYIFANMRYIFRIAEDSDKSDMSFMIKKIIYLSCYEYMNEMSEHYDL
ncbi:TPA: hypothetical protein OGU99_000573 [Escherichia coli]|nr:hypothetical protein A4_362 [Escherichia phage A4]HCQ0858647.1 hypothetical protein [Escherichia coli]